MGQTDSDLRKTIRSFRARAWVILICAALTAGAAVAFSVVQESRYSAQASLLFRDPGFDQRLFGSSSSEAWEDPAREAETNVRLASLDGVADRTADDLGGDLDGSAITDMLTVEPEGQSDVVSITATDESPESAARVANSFAENYIIFRRDADQAKVSNARAVIESEYSQLEPEEQLGEEGQALQKQISDLKTLEALQTGNAELVQRADPPSSPSSPKTQRNAWLGGILGIFIGVALALLRERLDRRLQDPEDLEDAFGLPILGEIPESRSLRHDKRGNASDPLPASESEAFRLVRTRLRYFNVDRELRSLLVTSASASDGKTTVAFYLARTAAAAGAKVILVEADLHEATLASEFGLSPLPGLAEVLTHQASPQGVIQRIPVENRGQDIGRHLDVMTAGAEAPNPLELVESTEMARLIEELTRTYDLVVIDTPPAGSVADSLPLMRLVSGVIVIGQLGKTTRDEAITLRDQLTSMEVPVLGIVLNRGRKSHGYGYGSRHGYGSEAAGPRRLGRRRRTRSESRPKLAAAPVVRTPGHSNNGESVRSGGVDNAGIADAKLAALNAASAEDLEALGLSASQVDRVMLHRDQAGGFGSLEDVEGVPGLPQALTTKLKQLLVP